VAQVTPVTSVAKMVGSNRVIQGNGIVYPVGDAKMKPDEEKQLRREIVRQALEALASEAG
jgi:glycine reductase